MYTCFVRLSVIEMVEKNIRKRWKARKKPRLSPGEALNKSGTTQLSAQLHTTSYRIRDGGVRDTQIRRAAMLRKLDTCLIGRNRLNEDRKAGIAGADRRRYR